MPSLKRSARDFHPLEGLCRAVLTKRSASQAGLGATVGS